MTPRKSRWFFLVVGLAFLSLLLTAPVSRATQEYGGLGPFHPGGDRIVEPPTGGPTGGGGGDGGDPDDYSNLLRAPDEPVLVPAGDIGGAKVSVRHAAFWNDPVFHAVLIWMGLER